MRLIRFPKRPESKSDSSSSSSNLCCGFGFGFALGFDFGFAFGCVGGCAGGCAGGWFWLRMPRGNCTGGDSNMGEGPGHHEEAMGGGIFGDVLEAIDGST